MVKKTIGGVGECKETACAVSLRLFLYSQHRQLSSGSVRKLMNSFVLVESERL